MWLSHRLGQGRVAVWLPGGPALPRPGPMIKSVVNVLLQQVRAMLLRCIAGIRRGTSATPPRAWHAYSVMISETQPSTLCLRVHLGNSAPRLICTDTLAGGCCQVAATISLPLRGGAPHGGCCLKVVHNRPSLTPVSPLRALTHSLTLRRFTLFARFSPTCAHFSLDLLLLLRLLLCII